jgi:hypothetical protein
VLADLPEEQRPIAELALQGLSAVRARVKEENAKLAEAGQPTMPEQSIVKMAEDLLPKLRVAEWLDRAEAALRQIEHLDLRDLRSVVAASEDPIVARDESTRAVADDLKQALARKQDEELTLWFGDIDAAVGVGRVIRALRLSSQPPKAGVMFPPDLARKLGEAATAALQPEDPADRWIAVLEAAAFSPVRTLVNPTVVPSVVTDDLKATVLRLGPALPQIAALLGVEVPAGTPKPKPLRAGPPRKDGRKAGSKAGSDNRRGGRPDRDARAATSSAAPVEKPAKPAEQPAEQPAEATPVADSPVVEEPRADAPRADSADTSPEAVAENAPASETSGEQPTSETATSETATSDQAATEQPSPEESSPEQPGSVEPEAVAEERPSSET